jgi:hypothetical protein
VPELFAVIVTFCAVEKFDGVNVSDVGDAVSPLLPLLVTVTVTFAAGAEDSDTPTVPVEPWTTDSEAWLTVMVPPPPVAWPVHATPFRVNAVGLVLVPE